ncbi:1-deoxy-D-xylulose-5-phosphate reductoisomerase [Coriobacteriia bacterium Es71-Z0120]|uniref:1-deoxy-D-xylulose-5-phosphate reductoisomerase n=1 Tax=Parvivirga hydrogeniphila TaxID=2939460 RepID=UPI002260D900|nr:1-deoxy-D-xylulose-5-phosphate reductoisomerase [Parvivirga hydrogeniphila]MCL4079591.1 1-deoxy-D-xylulose-5-phosphate reductoisomerase [Parvivirga hydrogeniphila]
MIRVAVLGSTGSIGQQTIDVAQRYPDRVRVVALAANRSVERLAEQAAATGAAHVAIADAASADHLRTLLPDARVSAGPDAVAALAGLEDADVVVNALVGAAGLRATVTALECGKRLALANKESLVVAGDLVMPLVRSHDALVPVDSEHSAIFQCLEGERRDRVARIWLTASGGPFRGMSANEIAQVTVEQALRHPRWSMGPKITIDSATLMNKGLEAIEAHHLFGVSYDRIAVVVHPQSCVHSMVEFSDGSVKAHLGATDMRIPIQYALSYPDRWDAPVPPVDFAAIGRLDFEEPDRVAFPCLDLALQAGASGGTMPAAMNAANEVAVAAFLERRIGFSDIPRVIETVMERHEPFRASTVDEVEAVDAWARTQAAGIL